MDESGERRRRIGGTNLRKSERPSKTYHSGRVCAEPGCETRLSIYNQSNYCAEHLEKTPPKVRGSRRPSTSDRSDRLNPNNDS
jgi:hypothetical protein